jgi:hypothetical protein
MTTIAFKRATHPFVHPDFIVEYIKASELESLDGWETLMEDRFKQALELGHKKQQELVERLIKDEEKIKKARKDASLGEILKLKNEEREYNRFKAWQKHNGAKSI